MECAVRDVIVGTFKTKLSKTTAFCGIILAAISLTPTDLSASIGFGTSPPFELNTNIQPESTHLVGYARDDLNNLGIGNAEVQLVGPGYNESVTTNPFGKFEFYNIDQASDWQDYTLSVSHNSNGYSPDSWVVSLERGETNSATVRLTTRTVILLHGINVNGSTWTNQMEDSPYSFKSYLEAEGFKVLNPSCPNPNASILLNAVYFEAHLLTLQLTGIQSYSIVAHSAGGLVTRANLAMFGGANRVGNFVTLGTPHHGSPLAALAESLPWWAHFLWGGPAPISHELVPGSEVLNLLNYGISSIPEEANSCTEHDPELLRGLSADRIYSIAGTIPNDWWHSWGAEAMEAFSCFSTDGIVPEESAHFWASDQFCTDIDLGCEVEHFTRTSVHFTGNECIAEKVKDILLGNPHECFSTLAREDSRDEIQFQLLPVVQVNLEQAEAYRDTVNIYALSVARFNCMWSGDELGFSLETPMGVLIDPEYADTSTSVTFYADSIASGYLVSNPEPGSWLSHVVGGADAVIDTVLLMYSVDTDLYFDATVTGHVQPDESILCQASFMDSGLPSIGSMVEGTVTKPDETQATFVLLDDGVPPDELVDDGIYSAEYSPEGLAGTYAFSFHGVVDTADPDSEERQDFAVSHASLLPDLAIDPVDFVIGDAAENEGVIDYLDEVSITAAFQNMGNAAVDSVRLVVDNLSYGVSLIDTILGFGVGEIVEVQVDWLAATSDTIWFQARATILGEAPDGNIENNSVAQWVCVLIVEDPVSVPGQGEGPEGGDGGTPTSGRILLSPNFPNPFNPHTNIMFTVPEATKDVEITLYDISGRKIQTLFAGEVEAGTHTLEWNSMDQNGRLLSSGVYFCRLRVGNEVQTRKIALVK